MRQIRPSTLAAGLLAPLALPAAALAQLAPATPAATSAPPPRVAADGKASSPDEAGVAAATAVDQVVVTADRTPAAVSQVGVSFSVLTLDQIRRDQEPQVADILTRTPGVTLVQNGGPGGSASIFIRGADSDETLVLIDGVKVNDPSDPGAGYDFSNLYTGDVARIEVLRGPQSTLYGSEAMGGVVNIVTAAATRPLQGDIQAEGGSYGTAYVRGSLGGKGDRFDWRLGAWSFSTDGVSDFDKAFGGTGSDPFHTAGASGRVRYDITPAVQLDERAYYTWSRNEFDGYDTPTGAFGNDNEFGRTRQVVDYTGVNFQLFDGRLKNRLAFEYDRLDRVDEDPDQPGTKFTFIDKGAAATVEYEGALAIAPGYQAVFGAQNQRSAIDANSPLAPPAVAADDDIASGYVQVSGEVLRGLTLTAGGRYDADSTFGGHATGQASAAWRLNDGNTILRASFGQGFKAPSLYQLYSEYGATTLRPEQADGWDARVEQHFFHSRLIVQATWFARRTRDLIEFVSCYGITTGGCAANPTGGYAACDGSTSGCATNAGGGYYANVDRAFAEGAEVESSWRVTDRLQISGNYTHDYDVDRTPGAATYGLQLPRQPRNTANASASYLWPIRLTTTVALRYADKTFDDPADTLPLQSYVLWDVRASYPLRPHLELYGRIENLTDKHYETAYEYGTLGRAAYAGVRYSF